MSTPSYQRTYQDHPDLWTSAPSVLAKVEMENGEQHVWATGWYATMIPFEHPSITIDPGTHHIGKPLLLPETPSECARYEIEIAMDEHNDCTELLSCFIGLPEAQAILQSMQDHPGARVSANRRVHYLKEIEHFNLLSVNLPSRSGNLDEPIRAIARWVRVFALAKGTVTVYEPLDQERLALLRWPHNVIWLNRPASWYMERTDHLGSLAEALCIPLQYLQYNLGNWKIEEALWRIGVYTVENDEDLERMRKDQATLALFIKDAVPSIRACRRRTIPHLNDIREQNISNELEDIIKECDTLINHARGALRDDLDILASASQLAQSRSSDKLNKLIETLSAVVLIPSIIISFFSMSILTAADTEPLRWIEALGVLLICALCALLLFVWLRRRKRK